MTRISTGASPYMLSEFHRWLGYDAQRRKTMTDQPKNSTSDEWARGYAQAMLDAAAAIGVKVGHGGIVTDCQCGGCVARREDHAMLLVSARALAEQEGE